MSDSLITTLCDLVIARLADSTELAAVTAVNQSDLRLVDKTQKALSGSGIVIVVMVDGFRPTPIVNDTKFAIGILITENLGQNRSGSGSQLPSSEAAEYVAASLVDWTPGDEWATVEVAQVVQLPSNADELQWSVDATTRTHAYPGS